MKKTIFILLFSVVSVITSYGYCDSVIVTATAASNTFYVAGSYLKFQNGVTVYGYKSWYWYHPTFTSNETNTAVGRIYDYGSIVWSSTNPVSQVYLENTRLDFFAFGECLDSNRSFASATLYVTW